jgi:hypothetical protein
MSKGGKEGRREGGLEGWRVGGLEGWRVGGLGKKKKGKGPAFSENCIIIYTDKFFGFGFVFHNPICI